MTDITNLPQGTTAFRLPSTADAERAKERERLIADVVAAVGRWNNSYTVSALEVIRAADALAAFDADNGGSKKSNPTDAAELERLREAKYQAELDMRTTAMSRDVPTAVSPRVWNAWITACDRLSAFEKTIGGGS